MSIYRKEILIATLTLFIGGIAITLILDSNKPDIPIEAALIRNQQPEVNTKLEIPRSSRSDVEDVAKACINAHCSGKYSTAASYMIRTTAGDYDRGFMYARTWMYGDYTEHNPEITFRGVMAFNQENAEYAFDVDVTQWVGPRKLFAERKLLLVNTEDGWKIKDCVNR